MLREAQFASGSRALTDRMRVQVPHGRVPGNRRGQKQKGNRVTHLCVVGAPSGTSLCGGRPYKAHEACKAWVQLCLYQAAPVLAHLPPLCTSPVLAACTRKKAGSGPSAPSNTAAQQHHAPRSHKTGAASSAASAMLTLGSLPPPSKAGMAGRLAPAGQWGEPAPCMPMDRASTLATEGPPERARSLRPGSRAAWLHSCSRRAQLPWPAGGLGEEAGEGLKRR